MNGQRRVPLFSVSNHHAPACGEPPAVDGDAPQSYHGYFENAYGEQAIFIYDCRSREATLRLGDAGWSATYRVVEGRVPELILAEEEILWLRACWQAAVATQP